MHNRMMKNDIDYKVNVMDERNISIKEKSGNITNMITMVLLGIVTAVSYTHLCIINIANQQLNALLF